ncbi:MAG TPA: NAD(P)/FAD-dependent oxidoreductase [Chloroflexota bacterium]
MAQNGVLGGGALGLTVALRLAERGEHVVVFEREPEAGGLASGFRVGPSYLEKFYHHLFRSDTAITELIEQLGLGDRLIWPRPVTSTLIGGHMRPLDSASSVLRFTPLSLPSRLRLGACLAYLKVEPNYRRLERTTAEQWIRRWMGQDVYETIWSPLLRAKFGDRYRDIAMPWFWARVHLRSSALGYLRGGFQQLYDSLVERIRTLGGEVLLGHSVTAIKPCAPDRVQIMSDTEEFTFDRVISTLPTRLTINLTPSLEGDYADRYGSLESFGAHCVILALDRPLTDVYWLNVNDPGYPFLALVEHTNYMPAGDYGGRHLVYLGNYLPMSHPLFRRSDTDVLDAYLPSLKQINGKFDRSWVQDHWIFRAPFAQPIVTVGYADRLPPHTTPVPNLYLANMSQIYPQDRGQNYSVAMANRLVAALLG